MVHSVAFLNIIIIYQLSFLTKYLMQARQWMRMQAVTLVCEASEV